MRTGKALARLRGCAGSPEPSLVAYVIRIKISCAGSFNFNRLSIESRAPVSWVCIPQLTCIQLECGKCIYVAKFGREYMPMQLYRKTILAYPTGISVNPTGAKKCRLT